MSLCDVLAFSILFLETIKQVESESDFRFQIIWRKETGCRVKNFSGGCHENRLYVLLAIAAHAGSRRIRRAVLDGPSGGRIAIGVCVCVYEVVVQEVAYLGIGERHGSHSVTSASHVAFQIP